MRIIAAWLQNLHQRLCETPYLRSEPSWAKRRRWLRPRKNLWKNARWWLSSVSNSKTWKISTANWKGPQSTIGKNWTRFKGNGNKKRRCDKSCQRPHDWCWKRWPIRARRRGCCRRKTRIKWRRQKYLGSVKKRWRSMNRRRKMIITGLRETMMGWVWVSGQSVWWTSRRLTRILWTRVCRLWWASTAVKCYRESCYSRLQGTKKLSWTLELKRIVQTMVHPLLLQ